MSAALAVTFAGPEIAAAQTARSDLHLRRDGAAAPAVALFRTLAVAAAAAEDSALAAVLPDALAAALDGRFIVVNLNARRLWYVERDTVRFAADVAVGRGTRNDSAAAPGAHATPRTLFTVIRKDSVPVWVPPDWHLRELAAKTGRSLH